MTALLIVSLIVTVIGVDLVVVAWRRRQKETHKELASATISEPRPPPDLFLDRGHCWVRLTPRGVFYLGVDDLVTSAIGVVENVKVPHTGDEVRRGEGLIRLGRQGRELVLLSPVSGMVVWRNEPTLATPQTIVNDPYGKGWVLAIRVADHEAAIKPLHLGTGAKEFLQQELQRLIAFLQLEGQLQVGAMAQLDQERWRQFQEQFLGLESDDR